MIALGHEVILVPIMKRICQTKTCQFTLKKKKGVSLTGTTSNSWDQILFPFRSVRVFATNLNSNRSKTRQAFQCQLP